MKAKFVDNVSPKECEQKYGFSIKSLIEIQNAMYVEIEIKHDEVCSVSPSFRSQCGYDGKPGLPVLVLQTDMQTGAIVLTDALAGILTQILDLYHKGKLFQLEPKKGAVLVKGN